MSGSLFDLAKQYLTPDVIDKLASLTGEAPAAATKGMGAAVPAVVAGMLQQASSPGGLDGLVGLFNQGKYDGGMLGNLAGAFSGSSAENLVKIGGPLLASLFGNRSGGITDMLASFAGVKRSTATTLLSLGAPFLMNVIGKQLASRGGVNAGSLKDLLFAQRGSLAAAAPAGLAQAFGLSDFSSFASPAREPVREEESPLKKLLPWLIGLLGLLLLFSFLRGCGKDASSVAPADSAAMQPAPTPAPAPSSATPSTTEPTSAPGTTIQGPAYNQQGGGTGTSTGGAAMPSGGTTTTGPGSVTTPSSSTPPAGAMGGDGPAGKDTAFPGMKKGTSVDDPNKVGAMGGRGVSGKDAPTAAAPTPQAQQKR